MNVKEYEKVFISPTLLTVHIRTHIEEKAYEYKECGETFTCSSKLTLQVRKHQKRSQYM